MCHHHPQSHNNILASRTTFPPERHIFLQGGGIPGESGLVLSTDAKPRLKWTAELHDRFIEAVNQLGGADKATPKTVMRLMGIPGLTLYHLKSHLQKYRLSKNLQAQAYNGSTKSVIGSTQASELPNQTNGPFVSNLNVIPQPNKTMQISEALQMQIEVQRRLHEQLEVQRHLQLRIEAQGKYLQSVLEKAQETLGKQNLGSAGLEAAKVQLSELVSKVSNECFNNAFPGFEEIQGVHTSQVRPVQHTDCSVDSCLTTSEGSQKERDTSNICMDLRTYHGNPHICMQAVQDCTRLEHNRPVWYGDLHEHKAFSSSILRGSERMPFSIEKDFNILPINSKSQTGDRAVSDDRWKERDYQDMFLEDSSRKKSKVQQEKGKQSSNFGRAFHATQLDLNANENNEEASNCKRFDLNGFS